MAERWDDQEFSEIFRLIREEEDRALEIFRQRNFDKRIRARIAGASKRNRSFFGQWTVVSASVAALLLIAAGTILMVTRRPSPRPQDGPGPMAVVLGDLPGISDLVMAREAFPREATDALGPARAFRTVLATSTEQKEKEERKATTPTGKLRVPRLSLEKKMEILFKDKAIEQVLVRIFRKSEEV